MRYVKKPEEVEAFVFTEEVEVTAPNWFSNAVGKGDIDINVSLHDGARHIYGCTIYSKGGGRMYARVGDYIVKGHRGNIYPCRPGVFKKDYECAGS